MYLGRVVGCVWATMKNDTLAGQRLLLVQPVNPDLAPTGRRIVCTDWTGAGAGELIYWVRGREASHALLPAEPPTDTTIVAIVDTVRVSRGARSSGQAAAPGRGKQGGC